MLEGLKRTNYIHDFDASYLSSYTSWSNKRWSLVMGNCVAYLSGALDILPGRRACPSCCAGTLCPNPCLCGDLILLMFADFLGSWCERGWENRQVRMAELCFQEPIVVKNHDPPLFAVIPFSHTLVHSYMVIFNIFIVLSSWTSGT